jgi:predicted dehydrogenase
MNSKPMKQDTGSQSSRRQFLKSSAAGAVGYGLALNAGSPAVAARRPKTQTLRVGLIGCGGRGAGAVLNALAADDNVELAAMGDLFENNLSSSLDLLKKEQPDKVKVPPERRFLGFDAFQKVVDSDVDVVLLATPPAFRPQHLQAAVDAGKHSFVEITAAIDAPGVRSVIESAKKAEEKGLAIVSGFCWRYDYGNRAALEQIRNGAIGEIRAIYATYYTSGLRHKYHGKRTPEMSDLEWQIRDWYGYLWLSGDLTLVLAGGHSVDKLAWRLNDELPTAAVAVGSRAFPADGNTYDNGFVVYEYANGIRGFLGCRTHDGCYTSNTDYIIGSKGTCTMGNAPVIDGETKWRYQGENKSMHQVEHDELFASIRAGRPINDGVRMAHTTLMAIMGRMAAYTGKKVSWERAFNSQQRLVPEKIDWDTKIEQLPLAVPGVTTMI